VSDFNFASLSSPFLPHFGEEELPSGGEFSGENRRDEIENLSRDARDTPSSYFSIAAVMRAGREMDARDARIRVAWKILISVFPATSQRFFRARISRRSLQTAPRTLEITDREIVRELIDEKRIRSANAFVVEIRSV
jgi:hypothetical protein